MPITLNGSGTITGVSSLATALVNPIVTTTMGVGNATPAASGAGITFPAAVSASSDANTLDDYEEGTFTPTFTGATTNPTVTYTNQNGAYVKIGRFVYAQCYLTVNTTSGGTGALRVSGLPFTSSSTLAFGGGTVTFKSGWTTNGPDYGHIPQSSTILNLYADNNTGQTGLTPANLANGCEAIFSIWYQVD